VSANFFWVGQWLECRTSGLLYQLSHNSSSLCSGYFGDGGVSRIICLGWPWTVILQISVSQVSRIIGVSQPHSGTWLLAPGSTSEC
jgi:hypothetical protein